MLKSLTENARSAVAPKGNEVRRLHRRNTYRDARAALAKLVGGRRMSLASESRAISQLIGLPHWLTAVIVERHLRTKQDCPIDEAIVNIRLDLENEGVIGPSS